MGHQRIVQAAVLLIGPFFVRWTEAIPGPVAKVVDGTVHSRILEIEEYPVQLEPFHIVYHHGPGRNENLDGMEEMDVLAATRNYLAAVLAKAQPDNEFQRLLLYLFIRGEDTTMTKVAYSGTAFYSVPTSPSMRQHIQHQSWLSFLGANKTEYLLELTRYGILQMESITLLTVSGDLVGIDSSTGALVIIPEVPVTASNETIGRGPPDTEMSSSVSMTIYLCAIIIPIAVFFLIVAWWLVQKLRHDVTWNQPEDMDPEAEHWQSAQRLEQRFIRPMTSTDTTFATALTHLDTIPTSSVIVPNAAAESRYLSQAALNPIQEVTDVPNGIPTNIIFASDDATTSTLGTFTTEHLLKQLFFPGPRPSQKYETADARENISKREFGVSKPRDSLEKYRPSIDPVKMYATARMEPDKTLGPGGTTANRSLPKNANVSSLSKAAKSKKSRPETPESGMARTNTALPKNADVPTSQAAKSKKMRPATPDSMAKTTRSLPKNADVPLSKPAKKTRPEPFESIDPATKWTSKQKEREQEFTKSPDPRLKDGLPPTPRRRDNSATRKSTTKRKSSKSLDSQAIKSSMSSVSRTGVHKPATKANDPPGTKLVTVNRIRAAPVTTLPVSQKADANGGTRNNGTSKYNAPHESNVKSRLPATEGKNQPPSQ